MTPADRTAPADDIEHDALRQRAHDLIARLGDGSRDDTARDDLLLDLLRFQARHVDPYRRLVASRGLEPAAAYHPGDLPALPTDVFRWTRVAVHGPSEDVRVFRTSGTTRDDRGTHPFRRLDLYDRAAEAAARHALFPDVERIRLVVLAPSAEEVPDSSLSYMLGRFGEWFGEGPAARAWADGVLALGPLEAALDRAVTESEPIALLGTSFAFVHADDALGPRRWDLPPGSRVMQTGGFKGRSREVAPDAMRAMLSSRYGVPLTHVVAEYGMTELSSQMYETTLLAPGEPRRLWVPGWVRAVPVHPETLAPVEPGEVGILRIDDAANVDGAAGIQTADLARTVEGGIEVLGREPGATPRGCSLAVDAILGGER